MSSGCRKGTDFAAASTRKPHTKSKTLIFVRPCQQSPAQKRWESKSFGMSVIIYSVLKLLCVDSSTSAAPTCCSRTLFDWTCNSRGLWNQSTWLPQYHYRCWCEVSLNNIEIPLTKMTFIMFWSIWLMECKAAGNGVELQVLFYRLARLLRYPVKLIFVFDGPKRPSVKRGHEVLKGTHWLTRGMQELLNAFGFPWYTVSI